MNENTKRAWVFSLALAWTATGEAATVTVGWNANPEPDLQGYRLFYRTTPLGAMTTSQALTDGSVTKVQLGNTVTHVLPSLPDGTSYYFRLTARDASGEDSGWAVQVDLATVLELSMFAPLPQPPAAPLSLTATAASSSRINLAWGNVANETGFRVERSLVSGSGYVWIASAAANATSFSDTGRASTTTYHYRVFAYNAVGDSASSPLASATTLAATVANPSFFAPPPGLKEAYVYPNPASGVDPVIRAMMGGVDSVEVTIYDQSGAVAHTGRTTSQTTVNGEPAFEYRWTGEKATGVYYAVIHGKKGDETIRARAKFAVVR